MIFNKHLELEGKHALLSPSGYHWIYYEPEKLKDFVINSDAVEYGTRLHEFAKECILLKQRLPDLEKTLNMYVNDAIGFELTPEQPLYYSDLCYGTADTISFENNFLRIHDLKTGKAKAHMEQLGIYAALFCLEYKVDPFKISFELRLYQNDQIEIVNPPPEEIKGLMEKIISSCKLAKKVKEENAKW